MKKWRAGAEPVKKARDSCIEGDKCADFANALGRVQQLTLWSAKREVL